MTLLEILVKELPGMGGWPEGAEMCHRFADEPVIDFYDADGNWPEDCAVKYGKIALPCVKTRVMGLGIKSETVTREQYEAALAESKNVEWNGEGLPPVGCECEWEDNTGWTPVTIKYLSNWVVVFSGKCSSGEDVEIAKKLYIDDVKFRPLRSEEERRRDKAINQLARVMAEPDTHNASIVYQAIAAGEIPHVKIV